MKDEDKEENEEEKYEKEFNRNKSLANITDMLEQTGIILQTISRQDME